MKFTRFLAPGSLDLLALRAEIRAGGCRYCDCPSALVAHGYLWGYAASGHDKVTRGLRFFCSNRRSQAGCGRTFSILWETVIPRCLLRTGQLFSLLKAAATAATLHGAWTASRLFISARSACRWVARWHLLAAHVRTRLCMVVQPPGKTDGLPDPLGLRHLAAAFPTEGCQLAAFQRVLQVDLKSHVQSNRNPFGETEAGPAGTQPAESRPRNEGDRLPAGQPEGRAQRVK